MTGQKDAQTERHTNRKKNDGQKDVKLERQTGTEMPRDRDRQKGRKTCTQRQ